MSIFNFQDKPALKFDNDFLCCPTCDAINLHQKKTKREYHEEHEDFIEIDFECEHCAGIKTMFICQHEGSTFMGWATC